MVALADCIQETTRNGLVKLIYENNVFVWHTHNNFRCVKNYLGCKKRAIMKNDCLIMRGQHDHQNKRKKLFNAMDSFP